MMTATKFNRTATERTVVMMKPEEVSKLTSAWKKTPDCTNRSQFIKKAINAYAGEQIFD